ncbi:uncharacterized protein [Miscanthus floridulus]|uniref:uncharacterized protein n=1 Tax=Miscanthus floridulus TaxID=154761 RepID=UPI0034592089
MGRGPLDHLPDIGEMAPGASASSPVLPGEGGEDASGPVIAHPGAEADTPEARALGKCAVCPMGSTAEVEQVAAGATQLPSQRTEGVLESSEGRLALADTEAVPSPPAPPFRKRKAEVPALAPLKSLKVSTGSTAHQVVEVQDAAQRGEALARADPKELVTQGEVTGASTERAGEETPMPYEAKARESDGAMAPLVAEAAEGETEAPRTSEAEATEAGALRTAETEVAGTGAPETTEAGVAGTGAPETAEAGGGGSQREHGEAGGLGSGGGGGTSLNIAAGPRPAAVAGERPGSGELEKEVTRAAEASVAVQAVLEAEIGEHDALKSAARTGALHAGVKGALAVISSHYAGVDLETVSDGYVLPEDDEEADEEVAKLMEAAEGLGTALARLFEEEVVPPPPSTDARDPEL